MGEGMLRKLIRLLVDKSLLILGTEIEINCVKPTFATIALKTDNVIAIVLYGILGNNLWKNEEHAETSPTLVVKHAAIIIIPNIYSAI